MGYNFMIKLMFRIGLLIVLCIPVIYLQCHIVKSVMNDVIKTGNRKKHSTINKNNHTTKEYFKIAK